MSSWDEKQMPESRAGRARASKAQLEKRWGLRPIDVAGRIEIVCMGEHETWVFIGRDGKNDMYELEGKTHE